MGFDIISGWNGIGEAIGITLLISAAIPVVIWLLALSKQAHDEVVEDTDHDIEA